MMLPGMMQQPMMMQPSMMQQQPVNFSPNLNISVVQESEQKTKVNTQKAAPEKKVIPKKV